MPDNCNTLYDRSFFSAHSFDRMQSAQVVLSELFRHVHPKSMLGVGCGIGAWLRVAGDLGVPDLLGVDGDYVDRRALMVAEKVFLPMDLAQPGLADVVAACRPPPGRFDLVLCLEVAEHLGFERSASLVDDLCRLGDLVLFSAAIPFQGGTGHSNEQWPEFWAIHFRARGYACFDPLRRTLWAQPNVNWWYAQNLFVFAREGSAAYDQMPTEAAVSNEGILSLVHPAAWLSSILNQWHPHRAAARLEEPQDLCALVHAWRAGVHLPPALRAVERARSSPTEARDVFPFTRADVDEPERLIAVAKHEAAELHTQLEAARMESEHLRVSLVQAQAADAAALAELMALRRRSETLEAANATLRGQVVRHEAALTRLACVAEAGRAAQEQMAALLVSNSWKSTAPLRALRRLFR